LINFFFSSRRRHTRFSRDWSSDVCSSDLPLQVLARMHVLAAADLTDDADALGRPRPADGVAPRLELLAQLVTGATSVPGPVLTAVVHGELLTLRPFGSADGVL